MPKKSKELARWEGVKEYIGDRHVTLGPYFSYQLTQTPRRILFSLSHYKFAAKMLDGKSVLEVGCAEGLGTRLLAETARQVVAVDIDRDAIREAKKTFSDQKTMFRHKDFLKARIGSFDGLVCFDMIEHIYPQNEKIFFRAVCRNLQPQGVCIIGTPNQTADEFASEVTRIGHVNTYTHDRLRRSMEAHFSRVFIFSVNDELIHTGFYPMAHYLLAVGCIKKERTR